MKLKFRLSLIVIGILIVVVGGLSILMLTQAVGIIKTEAMKSIDRLAEQQASYWEGREEGYLRVAKVTAGFLSDYEQADVVIASFPIGDTGSYWSIMIGSAESVV